MRIERIEFKNYRQYRDLQISFHKRPGHDLNIVIANNGTGKTNLINAINWCLYGEEPHLSRESQQLPRLNLNTITATKDGSEEEVSVELFTESEGNRITFKRQEYYVVHGNQANIRNSSFNATYVDEKLNTKMVTNEDAISYVNRLFPKHLREFFFFDGERLDTYFKSATGEQISNAIFQISNVHTLDRIADRLDSVINDFTKEAGKKNPQLEHIRAELESSKKKYKDVVNQINLAKKELERAREKREELGESLKNTPDISDLEKVREQLEKDIEKIEKLRGGKLREKRDKLLEIGTVLKLYPTLKKASEIIQIKVTNKEIPQTYDTRLLIKIIETHLCICGRDVTTGSHESELIEVLQKEIRVSSDVAQELMKMQPSLDHLLGQISSFELMTKRINDELSYFDGELDKKANQKNEIDKQIGGFPNAAKIKQDHEELETYKDICKINENKLLNLRIEEERLSGDLKKQEEEEKKELRRLTLLKELTQYIDFGRSTLNVVTAVKEAMMDLMRVQIEKETKDRFFSLIWKTKTFKNVVIDKGYNLHLIHSMDYECLGTVSAAERQLLALSFVLALHKVSGFESPVLIDYLAGRVSDQPRVNLGKALAEVSTAKQIILLFLPTEYSDDISKALDNEVTNKYNLKLSNDEQEVRMEVLK